MIGTKNLIIVVLLSTAFVIAMDRLGVIKRISEAV